MARVASPLSNALVLRASPSSRCVNGRSEIEFQCELNQPRVVARCGDAAEIARTIIWHDLPSVWIDARCGDGVEVADRVKVGMVEEIEKFGAELDVF